MTEAVPAGRKSHSRASSCLHRNRFRVSQSLAVLTIAYMLVPHPSLASANLLASSPTTLAVSCSSEPVTSTEKCHLDFNDKMKMLQGRWGMGVHPNGPNYFCFERQKHAAQARRPDCR
jgi:hypothetical protein